MEENQVHIPEGWKLTSFGEKDLFRIIGSGIKHFYAEKEYYSTSSIDGNKVLFAEQLITYRNRPSRANMQPIENSVWFAKMKNTFKILKATKREIEEVILSTGFSGIESTIVDCDYLMQILSSAEFNSQKNLLAEGSTQEAVNNTKIRGIRFLLPNNKTEQTQIATILSKVDEAITQTEQLIAKYTRIKTGLMQDLLTKGIDENGNIRSEETHEFKDSPLGRIPKEWDVDSLGNIINSGNGLIQTGPFGSQLHANEYVVEGIPVIMPQDIKSYGLDYLNIAKISNAKANSLKRHIVQENDIIFARRGDLSKCTYIPSLFKGAICGTGCLLIRLNKSELNPYWLELIYKHHTSQKEIDISAVGSTMKNLNTTILSNLPIPKISLFEQIRVIDYLKKIQNTVDENTVQLSKLQSLKIGLMQDLLSGKVRVNQLIKETASV